MKGENIQKYWQEDLVRKQQIILFLYCATKCPTDAKKIEYAKMS